MAKCPKCNRNWFWDWEQDIYRYTNGSEVKIIIHNHKENNEKWELLIFQCECGEINSSMMSNPNIGSFVLSIKEWSNIDWEKNGNHWDQQYLNYEDKNCLNGDKI